VVITTDPDIEQAIAEKGLSDHDATMIRAFSAFLRDELCWCGRFPHHHLIERDIDGRNPRTFALCSSHLLHDGYDHVLPPDGLLQRCAPVGFTGLSVPGHEDTPPFGMEAV
jgi:hypothetical protein